MSISNPLTDPLSKQDELYNSAQMDLIRAIAAEEEKLRKQKELRDTEARGKENDESEAKLPSSPNDHDADQ